MPQPFGERQSIKPFQRWRRGEDRRFVVEDFAWSRLVFNLRWKWLSMFWDLESYADANKDKNHETLLNESRRPDGQKQIYKRLCEFCP